MQPSSNSSLTPSSRNHKSKRKSTNGKQSSLVRWLSSPPLQHIPPFKCPQDPIVTSSPTLPNSPSEKYHQSKKRTIEALLEDESPIRQFQPSIGGTKRALKRNKSMGDTTHSGAVSPSQRRRNALNDISMLHLESLHTLSKHSPEGSNHSAKMNVGDADCVSKTTEYCDSHGKENRNCLLSDDVIEKETIPAIGSQIEEFHLEEPNSAVSIGVKETKGPTAEVNFSDEFDSIEDDVLHEFMTHFEGGSRSNSQDKPASIDKYQRFLVLECQREMSQTGPTTESDLVLRLFDEENNLEKWARCQNEWAQTMVTIGDYINIHAEFDASQNMFVVNGMQGFIILHPSKLISCTTVADSFDCIRRSVILHRIKPIREVSSSMIIGIIIHELCQKGLVSRNWTLSYIESELDRLISSFTETILAAGSTESEIRSQIIEMVPALAQWFDRYYLPIIPSHGMIRHFNMHEPKIHDVIDIEETIRSPMYGLKGVIDITSTTQVVTDPKTRTPRTLLVPIELKTGRAKSVSHRAQTTLYTLLMSDFYDVEVKDGFLAYLKHSDMSRIPSSWDEIKGLLIQRNRLAFYLNESARLPDMIDNQRVCGRCPVQNYCMIYSKMMNEQNTPSSLSGIRYDQTAHLEQPHFDFLNKWEKQLTREEGVSLQNPSQPWTIPIDYGERRGQSAGYLVIVSQSINETGSFRFISRLERRKDSKEPKTWSFLQSSMNPGDPISISHQETKKTLATGYITQISKDQVEICTDRPLRGIPQRTPQFDKDTNQSFEKKVVLPSSSVSLSNSQILTNVKESAPILYRIDKEDYANGMALVRSSLFSLADAKQDKRRRDLIMDLVKPHFRPDIPINDTMLRGSLNSDQRKVIQKAMSADDYMLLLGMPGTGKSTTITNLVDYLVSQGHSVLLTSYTHTAVDNLLLKLKERNVSFLRLGNKQKMHPLIRHYMEEKEESAKTVEELGRLYQESQVVAATCLGINHHIFNSRKFDYCIVDEASQISLPVCLGPLQFASVFVLVGDQYQLPPLMRSNSEIKDSSETSLFKVLAEAHPEAIVTLHDQYRMNASIMRLSNSLIYNFALRCGNAKVAESRLSLPSADSALKEIHQQSMHIQCKIQISRESQKKMRQCWIERSIDPSLPAVFLNTDMVPAVEVNSGASVTNPIESKIIHQLVACLIKSGLDAKDIGVIAPYRSQIKHIQNTLISFPEVEVDSVDRFQGRDKACILLSFTRSNSSSSIGDLLKDWRRLNVAITRAKTKLIMVGSVNTLGSTPLFKYLLDEVAQQNGLLHLPVLDHLSHPILTSAVYV